MTRDKIEEFLSKYPYKLQYKQLNQYYSNPVCYSFNPVDIAEFNNIIEHLEQSDLNTIIRTPSGAIKSTKEGLNNNYAWDILHKRTGIRITVVIVDKMWVFKIGVYDRLSKVGIYPDRAFNAFRSICNKYGINLDDYKINNGKEVKEEIESPLIEMYLHSPENSVGINNVHHIDFHSSYPAGLANTHPEFRPVLEEIYNGRHDPERSDINKAILNFSIGWMQSYDPEHNRYAEWAHLSRDAIHDNNVRIAELTVRLQATGHRILGYNTDGIWYQGEIYHGKGEGNNLGEWSNDHINCRFRSKSDGSYEFIENDVYYPVLRGLSTYDMIEPDRTKWQWGDIYKGINIKYRYDSNKRRIIEDGKNL